jgi:hypothetical protein
MRFTRRLVVIVAVLIQAGAAQQSTQEKHVKEIAAEQTPEAIEASPFCQEVRASKQAFFHQSKIDPATLEPDLPELMRRSDEVVLAGNWIHTVSAISPSGHEAITYYDVLVLRSWKGSHQAGDVLTFGLPNGHVRCAHDPDLPGVTDIDYGNWEPTNYSGMVLLFLRKDSSGLIEGYRLTGGKGTQGIFKISIHWPDDGRLLPRTSFDVLKTPLGDCFHSGVDASACTLGYVWPTNLHHSKDFPECRDPGIQVEHAQGCAALMQRSDYRVTVRDAMLKKYDGVPVSSFLREVQSVADSVAPMHEAGSSKQQ